jgi:hypothetical protein
MSLATHIASLMEGLSVSDLDKMRPVDRKRFAALCDAWALLAGGPDSRTPAQRYTDANAVMREPARVLVPVARAGEHAQ